VAAVSSKVLNCEPSCFNFNCTVKITQVWLFGVDNFSRGGETAEAYVGREPSWDVGHVTGVQE
jgi:hypothetical protein